MTLTKTHAVRSCTVLLCLAAIAAVVGAQRTVTVGEWPSYGGTNWSQKYSPLEQINRDNFNDLTVAWTWTTPDFELAKRVGDVVQPPWTPDGFKATALVVNGVMYLSTGLGQIAAIDPVSGATKWLYDPEVYKDGAPASVAGPWQTRGVAYWTDGRTDERLLTGTLDGYVLAVDARTGKPIPDFGENGKVDLHAAVPRADRSTLRLPTHRLWSNEQHYLSPSASGCRPQHRHRWRDDVRSAALQGVAARVRAGL